jgi:tetratricopeptide (TPR) repeat protein
MGVIYRKRGSLIDSINALREAVRTAESSDFPVYRELCYALDNYGLSLLRTNKAGLADEHFEKAHALRKEFGSGRDLAQSAANLGRQALLVEDFHRAAAYFVEALEFPDAASDDHLLANVLCGLAEARLRQGSRESVRDLLDRAVELNANLGNSDGISIAHALLARLFLLEGASDLATEHAELCRQESEKTNSATGHGTAALLLAMVALSSRRMREAHEYLVQAAQYSRKSGNVPLIKEVDSKARELRTEHLQE